MFKVYLQHLQVEFFIPKIIVPAKQYFTTKYYGRLFQYLGATILVLKYNTLLGTLGPKIKYIYNDQFFLCIYPQIVCLRTPCDWTGHVATPFIATSTMIPYMLSYLTRGKRPLEGVNTSSHTPNYSSLLNSLWQYRL